MPLFIAARFNEEFYFHLLKLSSSKYEITRGNLITKRFSSLGYAYRKVGEYAQALKAYDRALVLDPNYTEAIEYRAEAYLGLGRLDEAKAAYEKLFLRDPERAAQLLVACVKWAAAPAEGVDGEALTAFKGWLAAKEETAREMSGVSGEGQQEW